MITTLDWDAQQLAEKYVYAATVIPNLPLDEARTQMNRLDLKAVDRGWVTTSGTRTSTTARSSRWTTGPATSSPTSAAAATTARTSRAGKFQPQHDAASAFRQPGSAFKPIVYATAFDERVLTPGSLLLDISTDFGGGWAPKDADELERGPVLVRADSAQTGVLVTHGNHADSLQVGLRAGRPWLTIGGEHVEAARAITAGELRLSVAVGERSASLCVDGTEVAGRRSGGDPAVGGRRPSAGRS